VQWEAARYRLRSGQFSQSGPNRDKVIQVMSMSSAEHHDAQTTSPDTPRLGEKLKAVGLAAIAIAALIAMAGWLYFLASLIMGLAIWIFS
jgi:hypothetical protein